jgi:tetratricopeptide (TPR) repeat protein
VRIVYMAGKSLSSKINDLFRQCKWEEARKILQLERERDPRSHWVLTQLGVTFYEQLRYEDALKIFLASLNILGDCPLTLWNLAGTLDSLGKHAGAMQIYTWLLQSKKTADEDPCWESKEWTDALKTDCVYRMGVCFRHLGKKQEAEHCFRQYVNLLLTGIEGTYSIEDVGEQIQKLHASRKKASAGSELQRIFRSTLEQSGIQPVKGRRNVPPKFDEKELLPGRRVASKK